jgi:hypothetical protein
MIQSMPAALLPVPRRPRRAAGDKLLMSATERTIDKVLEELGEAGQSKRTQAAIDAVLPSLAQGVAPPEQAPERAVIAFPQRSKLHTPLVQLSFQLITHLHKRIGRGVTLIKQRLGTDLRRCLILFALQVGASAAFFATPENINKVLPRER